VKKEKRRKRRLSAKMRGGRRRRAVFFSPPSRFFAFFSYLFSFGENRERRRAAVPGPPQLDRRPLERERAQGP